MTIARHFVSFYRQVLMLGREESFDISLAHEGDECPLLKFVTSNHQILTMQADYAAIRTWMLSLSPLQDEMAIIATRSLFTGDLILRPTIQRKWLFDLHQRTQAESIAREIDLFVNLMQFAKAAGEGACPSAARTFMVFYSDFEEDPRRDNGQRSHSVISARTPREAARLFVALHHGVNIDECDPRHERIRACIKAVHAFVPDTSWKDEETADLTLLKK